MVLVGVPLMTLERALDGADRTWVEEYLTIGNCYRLARHPTLGNVFKYSGINGDKLSFFRVGTSQMHNYKLGGQQAIWNKVLL
tara:strand:+ start:1562 stop:1810 length:249 start_codon:yes stop_codon:yes gene_type:complete